MGSTTRLAGIETPASLVDLRRELHRTPELRFELHRTAARVEERVRAAGWDVRSGIARSGLLATLAADEPGPHVLLRADMDALPVSDTKHAPYASSVPGVTHACGHDVHTAVMVGVAERLASDPLPCGRVSIVFQPAEEVPYGQPSGAATMLAEGILEGDVPDAAVALHCWPGLPAGTIGVDERIAMGGKDAFHIELLGAGAHAATPSGGRDAVVGISQLVSALYQGFARSLDPGDLAALNVGTLRGGQSQSVVPPSGEMTGTIRSVDAAVRARLCAMVERVTAGVAATWDLAHEVTWADAVPAIVNDPRLVCCAMEVGTDLLGETRTVQLTSPPMTADDFAFFAALAPALYFKLGTCGEDGCAPLHSGAFDVDERAIGVGVAVMSEIALRLLERPLDAWAVG
jgi:amidohydrolase